MNTFLWGSKAPPFLGPTLWPPPLALAPSLRAGGVLVEGLVCGRGGQRCRVGGREWASSFRGQKHALLPAPHPAVGLQTDRRQGHPR